MTQAEATAAKWILGFFSLVLAIYLVWWFFIGKPIHDKSERTRTQAEAAKAKAEGDAARSAQGTVITTTEREAEIRRQQEEVNRAIDATKNAKDSAGDAGLAGLRVLCQRPAHRDEQRCRELLETGSR